MKGTKIGFVFVLMLAVFLSCKKQVVFDINAPDALFTNRDTLVNPSEDFFAYANGGWFKNNPIPETDKSNGIFRTIQDTINNQVKNICEKSALANDKKGSNKQKIGDFYSSGMDTLAIDKAGLNPIKNEIAKIDAVTDVASLLTSIAHLHTIGASPAFSFYVSQDDKISTKYAVFFAQGGLGLGNRDYYFNTDSETVNIRKEYVNHLQKMSSFLGNNEIGCVKNAALIMRLETDLAKASRKLEDLRDPIKNYNKMTVANLNKITPNISWDKTLPLMGIQKVRKNILWKKQLVLKLPII